MRYNQKQTSIHNQTGLSDMNFQQFMKLEGAFDQLNTVPEFGVSRGDIKNLKEKLNRA